MQTQRPGPIALAMTVFVIGSSLAALYFSGPPAAEPASAPATEFSAERAMRHVEQVAQRPHPVGSAEHDRVRDYIVREIEQLGLTVERQITTAVRSRGGFGAGSVENLLVRLPGSTADSPVLLATHYDSAPYSPGASDDGSGVAALLETLRALKAGSTLHNDIVALFTDAEEEGLLGAVAFVSDHPIAKQVRVAVNFEARGTRGPSLFFETGPENGLVVGAWARSVPHPAGSSLTYEVYKRLPNDTDFSAFKAVGIGGLNFAFIGNWEAYHTPLDSVSNLDRGTLQQHGEAALALAREFGGADLAVTRGPDAVYFSLPIVNRVVRYPASWATLLAALALTVFVVAARQAYRRKRMSMGGLLLAVVVCAAFYAIAIYAGLRVSTWVGWLHKHWLPEGNVLMNTAYGAAWVLAIVTAWALLYPILRKVFAAETLTMASAFIGVVLAFLSAQMVVGGSYVVVWPLFGTLLSALWMPADTGPTSRDSGRAFIIAMAVLPAVTILLPLAILFHAAIGLSREGGAALSVVTVIALGLMAPQLELISEGRRWWPACLALIATLGTAAIGIATTGYSPEHPKASGLIYLLDVDHREAYWAARVDTPGTWYAQYLGTSPTPGRPGAMIPPWASAKATAGFLHGPAPVADLPAPSAVSTVTAETASGRTLTVKVIPAKGGHNLSIWMTDAQVVSAAINGRSIGSDQAKAPTDPRTWTLEYANAPADGVELLIDVKGAGPLKLALVDWSIGLPAVPGRSFEPRPAWMVPAYRGDQTLVRRSYTF